VCIANTHCLVRLSVPRPMMRNSAKCECTLAAVRRRTRPNSTSWPMQPTPTWPTNSSPVRRERTASELRL
jgi:hypothetical protein